jgi:argininosuccinate lyase
MTKEQLAKFFHDTYESLAPSFGYETKKETRQFDSASSNGKLMIAVAEKVLQKLGVNEEAPVNNVGTGNIAGTTANDPLVKRKTFRSLRNKKKEKK